VKILDHLSALFGAARALRLTGIPASVENLGFGQ
jgi:hypothetical protein